MTRNIWSQEYNTDKEHSHKKRLIQLLGDFTKKSKFIFQSEMKQFVAWGKERRKKPHKDSKMCLPCVSGPNTLLTNKTTKTFLYCFGLSRQDKAGSQSGSYGRPIIPGFGLATRGGGGALAAAGSTKIASDGGPRTGHDGSVGHARLPSVWRWTTWMTPQALGLGHDCR